MIINFNYFILFLLIFNFSIESKYYSQVGQDKFLNERFFKNKKNCTFVDIGAHNGILISNSYFFEKELNWNGICIEPLPDIFQQLSKNRKCICLNCCISSKNELVNFARILGSNIKNPEALSGILNTYKNLNEIKDYLKRWGGKLEEIQILKIQSRLLNDILKEYNIKKIDYLSIDTEGAELDILKSIDYKQFEIHAITVENNYKIPDIKKFLHTKNFLRVAILEQDEVYANKNWLKKIKFTLHK